MGNLNVNLNLLLSLVVGLWGFWRFFKLPPTKPSTHHYASDIWEILLHHSIFRSSFTNSIFRFSTNSNAFLFLDFAKRKTNLKSPLTENFQVCPLRGRRPKVVLCLPSVDSESRKPNFFLCLPTLFLCFSFLPSRAKRVMPVSQSMDSIVWNNPFVVVSA